LTEQHSRLGALTTPGSGILKKARETAIYHGRDSGELKPAFDADERGFSQIQGSIETPGFISSHGYVIFCSEI